MQKLKLALLVCVSLILFTITGCGTTAQNTANNTNNTSTSNTPTNSNTPAPTNGGTQSNSKNPIVTITMASGEEIKVELYPNVAPNTVKNFISLVQKGFYNGTTFHRVMPQFMIQGGDPNGNGTGGPGYSIKGEFTENGFKNTLKHERGVISMARAKTPDSAGSQFFIMVAPAPDLDGKYAAFGKVLSGMETVDKIVNSQRDQNDKPLQSQVMKTVTVDTLGVSYGEPEVIKK
ncbi:peptidylprolyl isomerase [Desulfitobacterium sp.]|uniref:peptidylprolyl isomerase n=1 Tax=Desulfitobacterium sp. TaxID=49981 RepID=UPI002CECAC27|nr:peptidylprolyl isomerase [Desulfitobacterium sp.]HVJ49054.1 peptidylprolyl isomerase [Desulfitobacterium sp.]